jgi:hypothetical protein
MQNKDDNRVLGRRNARQLSAEELQKMLGTGNRGTLHMTSPHFPDE